MRVLNWALIFSLISSVCYAQGLSNTGYGLGTMSVNKVQTSDGVTSCYPSTLEVSPATLTCNPNGTAVITTGGGGGGSGTVTSVSTTAPVTGGTFTTSGTIGLNWDSSLQLTGNKIGVNWSNIPGGSISGINWNQIGGNQGLISASGFNWTSINQINTSNINWANVNMLLSTLGVNQPVLDSNATFQVGGTMYSQYNAPYTFTNEARQYEGLVATRGLIPFEFYNGAQQMMSRSVHYSTQNIQALKIAIPNWYVTTYNTGEQSTGGTATVTASVEYPAGVYTQITFGGNASGTILPLTTLVSDYAAVTIPANTEFYIRTWWSNPAGIIYEATNPTASAGAGLNYGATTPDLTLTTGGGISTSNSNFSPAAIIGFTNKPSFIITGDSRCVGNQDLTYNTNVEYGEFTPSLNHNYGYIRECVSSDTGAEWIAGNATQRLALWKYGTHIIEGEGYNDAGNDTNVQLLAMVQTFNMWAHEQNKKVYDITIGPETYSSDNWETLVNQSPTDYTQNSYRISYNTTIRAGGIGADGYFDIASVDESSLNSGLWVVNGTANYATPDGLHETSVQNASIASSGIIQPNLASNPWQYFNGNVNWADIKNIDPASINWEMVPNYVAGNSLVARPGIGDGLNWENVSGGGGGGSGTVTSVATDASLTGGPITTSGTLGINFSDITTLTAIGVNWQDFGRLSANQTFRGNNTWAGTMTGPGGGNVNYDTVVCGNSDSAGTALPTGTTPSVTVPYAGTIVSAIITGSLSAGNCSVVVDVWKANAAIPTVSNTITASTYPTLSTGTYSSTTISGWTTSVAVNDVIECNVRSNTCDNWNLVLGIKK